MHYVWCWLESLYSLECEGEGIVVRESDDALGETPARDLGVAALSPLSFISASRLCWKE
jgi:hypothetical protein